MPGKNLAYINIRIYYDLRPIFKRMYFDFELKKNFYNKQKQIYFSIY